MHSLPLSAIIISPNRQRQEFEPEALVDLANSIAERGLMHAPVMRETPNGLVLVAGERRLRAIGDLHAMGVEIRYNGLSIAPGETPYITLGELTELEAEEAELDENLRRKDLTWQEQAAAISRLHDLRTRQAAAKGEAHSLTKTINELAEGRQSRPDYVETRNKLIVAKHLDNPEVAKSKTVSDAIKVIRRQEETQRNVELSERVGATFDRGVHQLYNQDCREWLASQPAHIYDVILTDPPYGMGADSFGDGGGKMGNNEHHYEDSHAQFRQLLEPLAAEWFRVAKTQAHAYVFCDIDRFHELKGFMEAAGWYVFRTPLTVYKLDSGRVPLPEQGPRRVSEWCLYAIKGWKPVTAIFPDVIPCKLEENLGHGANKPVELFVNLLRRSCSPGDSVLDCFAGTGTIFPAAHSLKVRATGIELNPAYYGIAVQRLEGLDKPDSSDQ